MILHFIYLSGYRRFGAFYYLSIKTAFINLKPTEVYFYCDKKPETVYFKMIEKELSNTLKIEYIPNSVTLCGQTVYALQHRADYIRLKKLIERGGVYLDLDVLMVKPFDFNLNNEKETPLSLNIQVPTTNNLGPSSFELAMGLERDPSDPHQSLCNAVIITEKPNSQFLIEWLEAYEKRWGDPSIPNWFGHSTVIPMELAKKYPEKIMIRKNTDFYPFLWYGYEIFKDRGKGQTSELNLYPNSYCFHFFETEARKAGLIPETFFQVINKNSPFKYYFEKYIPKEYLENTLLIPQEPEYYHGRFIDICHTILDVKDREFILDTINHLPNSLMEYDILKGLFGLGTKKYIESEVNRISEATKLYEIQSKMP